MSVAVEALQQAIQTPEVERPNRPQAKTMFGHVCQSSGRVQEAKIPEYYNIQAIETGTLDRARELARTHQTRHCFNEESIIKHIERTGTKFDIVKASVLSDAHLAKTRHPDRASFYLLVPSAK